MKQFLTFLALTFSYMLCEAQATTLVVDNKVAGTLSQRILYDDKLTVENLKLLGEVNADDFEYLDELNSKYNLTGALDLAEVNVVSGGRYSGYGSSYISSSNNTLNVMMFKTSKRLRKLIIPRTITNWNDGSYYVANGSAGTATLYPNLNTDSLVIDCPNLKTIGNGIGTPSYLYIGEGVEYLYWGSKYMNRVPGASDDYYEKYTDSICVYLPSTLTSMYGNKRMGTPKVKIYSEILRPDNLYTNSNKWYDDVLTDGVIYAPNDTKEFYENSIFKHLDIVAPISVKTVSLNIQTLSLKVNDIHNLVATVSPSDADNKTIVWSSSDESVAIVDNNGNVTAINGGEAKITVSSVENSEIRDECIVTVIQPTTGIVLNKPALELEEDDSEQLVATITPDNASNKSVNWTSSDISVAMVSLDGTVYAIKPGQATIMATTVDGGFVALCKVTVKAKVIVAESLSLSTTTASLSVGETIQLSANILPENTSNKDIRWTSTNTEIAVVSESGLVSAIKEGNVQIVASTTDGSNLSAICETTVNSRFVPITQIAISPSSVKLAVGETFNLETQITPVDATNKKINWSSTNASVVTVDSHGQLTAKGIGKATIIASSLDGSNLSATCAVVVYEESGINDIEIDGSQYVRIYNLQGVLVYEGEYSESKLVSGTYIIISQGNSIKRVIR